jgi:hypothetical protein
VTEIKEGGLTMANIARFDPFVDVDDLLRGFSRANQAASLLAIPW